MGLAWIAVYYDAAGLLDGWFTIFIQVNQALASGLSQVLFSMAVIELAKPGQEAITYELIVSVANSALVVNVVVATQLLTPLDAVSCTEGGADDDGTCARDQVNTYSKSAYDDSHGPRRFTVYTLVVLAISLVSMLFFTPFLPRTKAECAEWKERGEQGNFVFSRRTTGLLSSLIAFVMVVYSIVSSVAYIIPSTACMPAFGGSGCSG